MTQKTLDAKLREILNKGDFTPTCSVVEGHPSLNVQSFGYKNICANSNHCPLKLVYDNYKRCTYYIILKRSSDNI